jgi:hypothetical protein
MLVWKELGSMTSSESFAGSSTSEGSGHKWQHKGKDSASHLKTYVKDIA